MLFVAIKVVLIPTVLLPGRSTTHPNNPRPNPLVNVATTLARRRHAHRARPHGDPTLVGRRIRLPKPTVVPVGFAVVLIAFFGLGVRRNAVVQIVGFLLLENGIAIVALLAVGRSLADG